MIEIIKSNYSILILFNLNFRNEVNKANTVNINKVIKLISKLYASEIKPNTTGPNKKPIKPIPDTKEIAAEADTFSAFPAILNNSGIITDKPRPITPKPITVTLKILNNTHK